MKAGDYLTILMGNKSDFRLSGTRYLRQKITRLIADLRLNRTRFLRSISAFNFCSKFKF